MATSDFIDFCKSATGNIPASAQTWCDENLPDDEILAKRLLVSLATKTTNTFKMSRFGLLFKVLFATSLTYFDELTDVRVTANFYNQGTSPSSTTVTTTTTSSSSSMLYFKLCLAFLIIPTLFNLVASIINTREERTVVKIKYAFYSIFQLNPIVHGYHSWRGTSTTTAASSINPFLMYMITRLNEVILEAMPEAGMQLYFIFHTNDVATIAYVSICCSLLSAAFTMADCSIMDEMSSMNRQIRGPGTHPTVGFIPDDAKKFAVMKTAAFLFYAGFAALALIALAAAVCVWPVVYLLPIPMVEIAVSTALMFRREATYCAIAPVRNGKRVTFFLYFGYYLIMSFAPWTMLRHDHSLGGGFFGGFILHKILSYSLLFYFSSRVFDSLDELRMSSADAQQLYLVALVVTMVSGAVFLLCCRETRRCTFYSSQMSSAGYAQWMFDGQQLTYDAEILDHQRVHLWAGYHPSMLNVKSVKQWILSLSIDSELLSGVDKKLPRGCHRASGMDIEEFFRRCVQRYGFYGDAEGLRDIEAHLKKLLAALDEREDASCKPIKSLLTKSSSSLGSTTQNENEARIVQLKRKVAKLETEIMVKASLLTEKEGENEALKSAVAELKQKSM
jgi:hypothetical protein